MRNIILKTLEQLAPALNKLQDPYYLIGGAALFLHNVPIGRTHDIDIVTSVRDAKYLQELWSDVLVSNPAMKDDGLFQSYCCTFKFPLIEVEVQGDLRVFKNGTWHTLPIIDVKEFSIDNITIKLPTLCDIKKTLALFDRPKDLRRIAQIDDFLHTP